MALRVEPADFKCLDRTFAELKQERLKRESEWQLIADVFAPRKDFSLPQKPADLRKRRLMSSVPQVAARRGAALLIAYLIDHAQPFIKPNVERGLIAAGRPSELDSDSAQYLTDTSWRVFDAMMLPESRFLTSSKRMAVELELFGSAVQWVGRKRGFGAKYLPRPLRACWFSENEDGDVDTLYFQFTLPLWRAVERWPDHGIEKWRDDMADEAKARQAVTIVHAVYPRIGGVEGAEARGKPFAEIYMCVEHKCILFEGGYDSFPYAVPRLDVEEGSCYGTGLAWHVLPEAYVLHALTQGIENAVELKNNPPLFVPKRMFGKAIDRRAGAVNYYDAAGLGFQTANQAMQRADIAGDVAVAASWLERMEQNVEAAFLVDWMRLRLSGTETAEAVKERRELRIRTMAGFVPEIERDWMGKTGDRTLEVLAAEGVIRNPPAQLSGVNVDWDYAGPLAVAQLKGQVDSFEGLLRVALAAKELDETAGYVVDVEEGLREVAEALSMPPRTIRSRKDVAALRERDRQAKELAQNAQLAEIAGRALQAGGQGAANLATADQIQNGAPGRKAA